MSDEGMRPRPFDARMRRILASTDTSPGFEARVMDRIASLRASPTARARARVERGRELARLRLRREAWMNVTTAAGIGAAAIALIWRRGPVIVEHMQVALDAAADPGILSGVALAVLAVALWPLLRRFMPR
jgi:hypothetical protein